jgi:hypothetical protein
VLVKHQLLILNRSRKRSPNLRPSDRVVACGPQIFGPSSETRKLATVPLR